MAMFRSRCVILLALLLGACGGGGGGGSVLGIPTGSSNLNVDFSYTSGQIYDLDNVTLAPELGGLDGNSPSCSVSSGALPQGLSLDGSCNIVGAATQTGTFNATISLTVANHSGAVQAPISLQVVSIQLLASPQLPSIQAWQPVASTPLVELDEPGNRLPGDDGIIKAPVKYVLAPGSDPLPPGLTLDPNTAALSGTPTGGGTYKLQIEAQITESSGVYTVGPTLVTLTAYSGPSLIVYPLTTAYTDTPISAAPTQTVTPPNAKTFSYSVDPAQLPPGVTLNPTTGVLSGTPVVAGNYTFNVTETVGISDGSTVQGPTTAGIQVNGYLLVYSNQPFQYTPGPNLGLATPSSKEAITGPVPAATTCTGCSYSMIMAPGSTAPGVTMSTQFSSWVMVDPVSASVYITTPPTGTPAGQYNFYVVTTGTLNGTKVVSMSPFNVNLTY